MPVKLFGERLKELRLERRITLRKFSQMVGIDPGNVSRIERGKINPPQELEKLEQIALILGLIEDTDEYDDFISLAHLSAGKLPQNAISDEQLVAKLPLFFRTLDGRKLTDEQLDAFIEKLKEEL